MQPEATLTIEVRCDECKRKPSPISRIDAFIEMEPKIDTKIRFYLCVRCWLSDYSKFDGAKATGRVLEPTPAPMIVAPPAPVAAPKKTRRKTA